MKIIPASMRKIVRHQNAILVILILACLQPVHAQNVNVPNKVGPLGVEVNTRSGNVFIARTDAYLPGRQLDFDICFSYNSYGYKVNRGYGNGWMFEYAMYYKKDSAGSVAIVQGDGREDLFKNENGQFTPPVGHFDSLIQYQPNKYIFRTTSGLKYFFDNNAHKRLTKLTEPNGNFLNFNYTDSLVTSITNNAGQTITFAYTDGKLTTITDANASPVQVHKYAYDSYGNLATVTDPMNGTYVYHYLLNGPMSSIQDKNKNVADIIYYRDYSAREVIGCNSRTGFSYDTTTRTSLVTDFVPTSSNQTSTYIYNERGWLVRLIGSCCGYDMGFTYDNNGNLIQRKDAKGNVYNYSYDNRGNYLTVTDPLNNVTAFAYSPDFNRVTNIIDPLGNTYTGQYNPAGDLTKITSPGNAQEIMSYNAQGDLLSYKDANNNSVDIVYDAYGYPQKITYPLNIEAGLTFDPRGNLLGIKDANGNNTVYQYDSLNRVTKLTDALNHLQTITYDKQGNITSFTDPKGFKQTYTYDASNRTVAYKDAKGNSRFLAYDAMHNIVSATNALGKKSTFNYDKQNRIISIIDAVGNGFTFEYDANGNMTAVVGSNGNKALYTYDELNRIIGGQDDSGPLGSIVYDKNGNMSSFTDAGGASVTFSYDGRNRITRATDPIGNSRIFAYDNNSNLLSQKDRNDHITSYTYNAVNRVTSYSDNNGNHIDAIYDSSGNVTRLTDQNGNNTYYKYDELNRLIKSTFADGSDITMIYDNNNNIVSNKRTDGNSITYTYDSLNRLVTKDLPGGEHYTYNYDAKSRLLTASNATGTLTLQYDDINRLLSETFNSHTTSYQYDVVGRNMSITYPDGTIVTKTVDKRSRLLNIQANNKVIATFQYNNVNQLVQKDYANGVNTTYQYNAARKLSGITTNKNNLPGLTFQYDKEMNITVINRSNDPMSSETFSYDAGYRLIDYKKGLLVGGTISSPVIRNTYTYDGVGNRVTANLNGLNTVYTVNNLNQLTHLTNSSQNIGFTYDGNGNQTYDGMFSMRFDAEGRKLVDSTTTSAFRYQYDVLGRRARKISNGLVINYYYAGLQQAEERNAADSLLAEQVYLTALMPVVRNINNQEYFFHSNQLGSTEAITDSTGKLIEKYGYQDFGKTTFYDSSNNALVSSSIGNTSLFTGQKYDQHNGGYNFHYRNYSPSQGSFAQRDPIGYADKMGMYQYVGNNPGSLTDPLGLAPCPPTPATATPSTLGPIADGVLFGSNNLSNITSFLEVLQRNSTNKKLYNSPNSLLRQTSTASKMSKGLRTLNGPIVNGLLLPWNIVNTLLPAMDLAANGSTNNAIQNTEDVINMTSSGATTVVGVAGLSGSAAEGSYALATTAGGAAPALFFGAALAGGLAMEGGANFVFKQVTGESFSEYGYNHDIPGVTEAFRGMNNFNKDPNWGDMVMNESLFASFKDKYREAIERARERQADWAKTHPPGDGCPPNDQPHGTQQYKIVYNEFGDPELVAVEVLYVHDPNAIIGPDGTGEKKWVSINDRLPYSILFENDTSATTAVKVVKVVYPIDPKQDPSTIELSDFGFNNQTFTVPQKTNNYYQRLDVRDSLGLYVDITAGFDGVSRKLFWIFESIDPVTLLPTTDPLKGFLLKRDKNNPLAGNGFVNFTIKPVTNAHTGDTINAYGQIVFDTNDTIPTNFAKNTIDALPPTSHLTTITQTADPLTVKLNWTGNDDPGGSGVASYSLYLSINGRPYSLYRSGITENSLVFTGVSDSTYCFFISGIDSVNNQEQLKNNCERSVLLNGVSLPLTWLSFTGIRQQDDALLTWSTAAEINTRFFVVERSIDGIAFSPIGNVNAAGNSSGVRTYNYIDPGITHLGVTFIYYRIREVDIDGHFSYSRVVVIRVDSSPNSPLVNVFPNPFSQYITLQVTPANATDKTNRVELYSMQGVLMYRKEIGKQGNNTVLLNDLPHLPAGVYILKTVVNDLPFTSKLVKE